MVINNIKKDNLRVHKIRDMLIRMNKLLSKEIGSLNKSNTGIDGKFHDNIQPMPNTIIY